MYVRMLQLRVRRRSGPRKVVIETGSPMKIDLGRREGVSEVSRDPCQTHRRHRSTGLCIPSCN